MRGDDATKKTRKIFGTDGVRGLANSGAMTPANIMAMGMAAGQVFRRGAHRHRVVIGKDTRLSGYMIEPALTAGFTAAGMDVYLLGPVPTPAMAMLTRSMRADLGVMISASHNPYYDNGLKFFGPDGYKLSDETELEIEHLMSKGPDQGLATSNDLGRAQRIEDSRARYIEFAKATFPRRHSLEGMRIVLDCANGAGYKVAPTVLWELGAEVIPLGVSPNGTNINQDCGSTHPEAMCAKVKEIRADIGIALDGDADRVIICDEHGTIVDGDQIMATIAAFLKGRNQLQGGGVVSTIMSNMGLEKYLKDELGLGLERTQVGDRYVVERMRDKKMNLGGEPSGHIIISDYATTGDGLVTALQVLAVLASEGGKVSEVCSRFTPWPLLLKNIRYTDSDPLEKDSVKKAIVDAEKMLGDQGRLVIRKSGTEPLVRVMAEGTDEKMVADVVDGLLDVLKKVC